MRAPSFKGRFDWRETSQISTHLAFERVVRRVGGSGERPRRRRGAAARYRVLSLSLVLGLGVALGRMFDGAPGTTAAAQGQGGCDGQCAAQNGDVNADGTVDLTDAVTILNLRPSVVLGPSPPSLTPTCRRPRLTGDE